MPVDSLDAIGDLLAAQPDVAAARPQKLLNALTAFVTANEDAARSPNYAKATPDDLEPAAALLGSPAVKASDALLVRVLKCCKILSRKYDNRVGLGATVVDDLVDVLHADVADDVAGEAANVVLNICYERENVARLVDAGGVPPLVAYLGSANAELQANAAGAIQSICFQKEGRAHARDLGAIEGVLPLLSSPSLKVRARNSYPARNSSSTRAIRRRAIPRPTRRPRTSRAPQVQTRAVGAVHNMSSEPEAIKIVRRLGGIGPLVALLRAPSAAVCGSAAGALQNLSREAAARKEARELGAVVPLGDLLFGTDVQSQVCAAGAILNILGPELGAEVESNKQRRGLKKLLSLAITLGMLHDSLSAEVAEGRRRAEQT